MSHLTLQRSESPSDSRLQQEQQEQQGQRGQRGQQGQREQQEQQDQQKQQQQQQPTSNKGDSPTIGRAVVDYDSVSAESKPSLPPLSISTPGASWKSQRKPIPSPLQTSTAVSPPSSASPSRSTFPVPVHKSLSAASVVQISSPGSFLHLSSPLEDNAKSPRLPGSGYLRNDLSPPATPVSYNSGTKTTPFASNDTRSVSHSATTTKPPVGSAVATLSSMAGGSTSSRRDASAEAPRNSSIDSAISALSSKTYSHQSSQDAQAGSTDVAKLVKAAGSPEAVIHYLLKEKQSQSQQNTQLWRLVDKQRAMILGLNKDLERALKDKEKYRKKLKDVMGVHDEKLTVDAAQANARGIPRVDVNGPKEQELDAPASPSLLDSDSVKHSPIDVALAPYPITPPADPMSNGPPSAVGELLDPSHAMPKPSEHALDNFDREEEDRAAEAAKKASDTSRDLPLNLGLPPSRSLPSEPPRMPPPKPPIAQTPTVSVVEATPMVDQGISQFPPPSAPPPRKPPPAPLQLKRELGVSAASSPEDENDSDSDYDSLLEVDELPALEKRGRRRTREEDEREREILAQKEAEARSLSKKSKKGSVKGTPTPKESEPYQLEVPASLRIGGSQAIPAPEAPPASLAGVLSGNDPRQIFAPPPPPMSPGLPASPRPMGLKSPPLSPRGTGMTAAPLLPRPPRQAIPLPLNSPLSSPPHIDPPHLTSPKPLNIARQVQEQAQPSSSGSRESPVERMKIYKGFVTEEYPELLLPPNALPSIVVKVASSRMKPSRASLMSLTQLEEDPVFTLAIFSRFEGVELWRVEKDTSSLSKLDQKMKQCASFTARTPDRSLFSGHAPAKLDARRVALDQYLEELLNSSLDTPTALELCKYLSTNTIRPHTDDASSTTESSSEEKKGPGGRPFKNGYLTKRGKNFGGWKARFFVLDGPYLKYYETPGGAHLGTIKLQNAQIGKQSQQTNDGSPTTGPNGDELDHQYRHAFLVLEPKKKDSSSHVKHVLCAESDEERDQWVDALLRWIDYRDPADDEPRAAAGRDRLPNGSNANANGPNGKKRTQGQGKHQKSSGNSQDGLIGMSYNSAKQGDVPDGAPQRRETGTPDLQDRTQGTAYGISGPKDPQLIPDTATWGNKTSLAVPGPTTDEKKQRKRSFFGFGSKNRSSPDEQDPLYTSNGSGNSQGQSEQRGPVRQAFGAQLADAVSFGRPFDANVPLPAVVYRCIQYLDAKNAVREEGIFRLSGSNILIKQLRERFNSEGDVNLLTDDTYYDIHAVASLLKLYLRELPNTILTTDLHMQFVSVTGMSNHSEKIMAFRELVERLPLANETLLKYLIAFLIKIINHSDMNKMTIRNVGIVFSPTLNIPAPVFALMLQNYEGVFGISPEEYELPLPVSETDSRAPRRPSAASGMDSPHIQRLKEQTQRSTPTPPPRQTPYESMYMSQGNGSHASLRSAYETSIAVPPGYDPNISQGPISNQPAYDRPNYGPSYEQSFGNNSLSAYDPSYNRSKRRESSMLMGNMMLNQQGSKSRLREETRM
ncbi:RhoGAP-domain-containing protein [Xylariaceae sp. FL0662B]|nr:RhoGAP-domain-containing protein [Xylariaceae sp. FL0662B]